MDENHEGNISDTQKHSYKASECDDNEPREQTIQSLIKQFQQFEKPKNLHNGPQKPIINGKRIEFTKKPDRDFNHNVEVSEQTESVKVGNIKSVFEKFSSQDNNPIISTADRKTSNSSTKIDLIASTDDDVSHKKPAYSTEVFWRIKGKPSKMLKIRNQLNIFNDTTVSSNSSLETQNQTNHDVSSKAAPSNPTATKSDFNFDQDEVETSAQIREKLRKKSLARNSLKLTKLNGTCQEINVDYDSSVNKISLASQEDNQKHLQKENQILNEEFNDKTEEKMPKSQDLNSNKENLKTQNNIQDVDTINMISNVLESETSGEDKNKNFKAFLSKFDEKDDVSNSKKSNNRKSKVMLSYINKFEEGNNTNLFDDDRKGFEETFDSDSRKLPLSTNNSKPSQRSVSSQPQVKRQSVFEATHDNNDKLSASSSKSFSALSLEDQNVLEELVRNKKISSRNGKLSQTSFGDQNICEEPLDSKKNSSLCKNSKPSESSVDLQKQNEEILNNKKKSSGGKYNYQQDDQNLIEEINENLRKKSESGSTKPKTSSNSESSNRSTNDQAEWNNEREFINGQELILKKLSNESKKDGNGSQKESNGSDYGQTVFSSRQGSLSNNQDDVKPRSSQENKEIQNSSQSEKRQGGFSGRPKCENEIGKPSTCSNTSTAAIAGSKLSSEPLSEKKSSTKKLSEQSNYYLPNLFGSQRASVSSGNAQTSNLELSQLPSYQKNSTTNNSKLDDEDTLPKKLVDDLSEDDSKPTIEFSDFFKSKSLIKIIKEHKNTSEPKSRKSSSHKSSDESSNFLTAVYDSKKSSKFSSKLSAKSESLDNHVDSQLQSSLSKSRKPSQSQTESGENFITDSPEKESNVSLDFNFPQSFSSRKSFINSGNSKIRNLSKTSQGKLKSVKLSLGSDRTMHKKLMNELKRKTSSNGNNSLASDQKGLLKCEETEADKLYNENDKLHYTTLNSNSDLEIASSSAEENHF